MIIIWKDINGWEEYYEVNEFGEVRNKLNNRLIIGDKNSIGYLRVYLHNKNHIPNKQRFFRHRLVAEHFIPNPNNSLEVNHKDCNIENNHMNNLEWVDKKYNELHSHIYGSKPYKPFKVEFENQDTQIFNVKNDLAQTINVTDGCVKHWLQKKNQGYLNYGIKNIEYI